MSLYLYYHIYLQILDLILIFTSLRLYHELWSLPSEVEPPDWLQPYVCRSLVLTFCSLNWLRLEGIGLRHCHVPWASSFLAFWTTVSGRLLSGKLKHTVFSLQNTFFFPFIFISWRLITLQYCSGFCHTLTWISHGVTCSPHPDPPLPPPSPPDPSGSSQCARPEHLSHVSHLGWWSVSP